MTHDAVPFLSAFLVISLIDAFQVWCKMICHIVTRTEQTVQLIIEIVYLQHDVQFHAQVFNLSEAVYHQEVMILPLMGLKLPNLFDLIFILFFI